MTHQRTARSKTRNLLKELQGLTEAIPVGSGLCPKAQVDALRRFLEDLTDGQRSRVVASLVKLPRAEQAEIHRVVVEHAYWLSSDGPAGPGAPLLTDLLEALNAQVELLPDPEAVGGPSRSAEDWRAIYESHMVLLLTHSGWPDALGRAAAEDLTRLDGPERSVEQWTAELVKIGGTAESVVAAAQWAHDLGRFYAETSKSFGRDLDEVMRDDLIKSGMPRESADSIVADGRRNRKWLAASDAALPAKVLADQRAAEDIVRKGCGGVAKHADAVAAALAALAVDTTPARSAAALRDGAMGALTTATTATLPKSPAVFALVQKEYPGAKGSPDLWYETAEVVDDLVAEIAEGAAPDGALVAARKLKTVAEDARTWGAALTRKRGRPTKPGVEGAVALRAKGLQPGQIAMVLDRHGLKLDGPSPAEAARQADKTRRRRTGTK